MGKVWILFVFSVFLGWPVDDSATHFTAAPSPCLTPRNLRFNVAGSGFGDQTLCSTWDLGLCGCGVSCDKTESELRLLATVPEIYPEDQQKCYPLPQMLSPGAIEEGQLCILSLRSLHV